MCEKLQDKCAVLHFGRDQDSPELMVVQTRKLHSQSQALTLRVFGIA